MKDGMGLGTDMNKSAELVKLIEVRALALFDHYVGLPEPVRQHELTLLKHQEPQLHERLVALLMADARGMPLLDRSPIDIMASYMPDEDGAPIDRLVGTTCGAWKIVGLLGRGGMGDVYAVERADGQYQQSAALKHIRMELRSPRLIQAFLSERDNLAMLTHPGIVPVLDGGVDNLGHPWFVMRRVHGEHIDSWCDERRLNLRARVRLFLEACDAVAYAHQRGVLHQDIKPSNLLVTQDGRTQLLDFGLSTTLHSAANEYRGLAVTDQYTAPEILLGGSPNFTTDIYALGVLLYRMLCGQFPQTRVAIPIKHRTPPDVPSWFASHSLQKIALQRGARSPEALGRKLSGDLDAIALKCVAPDPQQRYQSIELLQHDLKQWLASRPISMRAHQQSYLIYCFVRRHKVAIAAGGVLCLSLVTGAGLLGWQSYRAYREMATASQVDQMFEQAMGMATLSGLGDTPLTSTQLLEQAERKLRQSSAEYPEAMARGLSILARNWAITGDYGRASSLAQESQTYQGGDALQKAFNQATLAQIQNMQSEYAQAEISATEGLSSLKIGFTEQHQLAAVRLKAQIAQALSGQGRSRDAFRALDQAIDEAGKLSPTIANPIVSQLLIQRGSWYRNRMRMKESEADLLRAVSLTDSSDPIIADDARESLIRTVRASRQVGRETRALSMAEQLLHSRQRLLGPRHPQTGMAWAELAFVEMLNRDTPAAEEAIRQAEGILRPTLGEHHPAMARVWMAKAHFDTLAGKLESGITWAERAQDLYLERYGKTHEFTLDAQFLQASQYWGLYNIRGDIAARQQALNLIRSGILTSVSAHGTVAAIHRLAYATLLANSGDWKEARKQMAQARLDAAEQYGAASQETLHVRLTEASILIDSQDSGSDVGNTLDSLISDASTIDTLYAQSVCHSAYMEKARWLVQKGRVEDARSALLQAKSVAVSAGQAGWVAKAEQKLQTLDGISIK
ncbi:MAG TPA: serine/threonine-protein kinase [Pseudoxanthomonas sp.]